MNDTEIKEMVKERYSEIASRSKIENDSSCCGATSCSSADELYSIMSDDYSTLEGYQPEADLGLGCGLPTKFAKIREGDTVVDLGSGAGNDAFIARRIVGNKGLVIGIDFTEKMIELARNNATKLGYRNVEFRFGDIESMPVFSDRADVIVSNCVLNLVPNKYKAFGEIYRVLRPGGHFSVSDIVLNGQLPAKWKAVAELYAGCVAGAIDKKDYLEIIREAGFTNITIQKEKRIVIPEDILGNYLNEEEMESYRNRKVDIESITVYAEKPAKDERGCCEPGNKCC